MTDLTSRQLEVLAFIRACVAMNGMPPTRAEIASHFKFSSINASVQHLKALEQKGAIRTLPGSSRGIVVVATTSPPPAAQSTDDLASLRARTILNAIEDLDSCCGHCEYEESEGDLLRHCDRCCRKIAAAVGLLKRKLGKQLGRVRAKRRPVRPRIYRHTHAGGTLA